MILVAIFGYDNLTMKGQTLIEALAALAVAVAVVSAITIAAINSLNNVQFSKNQNLATSYAQQGMEIVRQIRNRDWNAFYNLKYIYYCLPKDATSLTQGVPGSSPVCDVNIDNIFKRQVLINHNSDCAVASKVNVSVFWSDNKCTSGSNLYCHKVELVSCFSDSAIVPTP